MQEAIGLYQAIKNPDGPTAFKAGYDWAGSAEGVSRAADPLALRTLRAFVFNTRIAGSTPMPGT